MNQPKVPYAPQLRLEDFVGNSQLIIKDYVCSLCRGIYFNPLIDTCGHIMCEKCVQNYDPSMLLCPLTNIQLPLTPKRLNIIASVIDKQTMSCLNKNKGCKWEGQVKDYYSHIEEQCPKQIVKCHIEECQTEVFREDYQSHLIICDYRSCNCQYCDIKIFFIQFENHYGQCPEFPVDCPNKCLVQIQRKSIENHVAVECDFTLINCSYYSFGCLTKIRRKEMDQHKKDNYNYHLELVLQTIYQKNYETNEKFKKIEEKLDELTGLKEANPGFKFPYIPMLRSFSGIPNIISSNMNIIFLCGKRSRQDDEDEISEKMTNKQLVLTNEVDETNSIFDIANFPKEVIHKGNKAKCVESKTDHMFVFFKTPQDINTTLAHWRIKFTSAKSWVAAGVCNKEKVLENQGKFYTKNSINNHGSFVMSSNNYLWNTNVSMENNINVSSFPPIQSGDILDYTFDPNKAELLIENGNYKEKLTNITGKDLTCCIVFIHIGTEVEVLLDLDKID